MKIMIKRGLFVLLIGFFIFGGMFVGAEKECVYDGGMDTFLMYNTAWWDYYPNYMNIITWEEFQKCPNICDDLGLDSFSCLFEDISYCVDGDGYNYSKGEVVVPYHCGRSGTPSHGGLREYCYALYEVCREPTWNCGDGNLETPYEQCDDRNVVNGDGCSFDCFIEDVEDTDGDGYLEISTCQQLQSMREDLTADYELVRDVDCSDTVNWNGGKGFEPIGWQMSGENIVGVESFEGELNGNGYSIRGLFINRSSNLYYDPFIKDTQPVYVALFNSLASYSKVFNLSLENLDISHLGIRDNEGFNVIAAGLAGMSVQGLLGQGSRPLIAEVFVSGSIYALDQAACVVGGSINTDLSNIYGNCDLIDSDNSLFGGLVGLGYSGTNLNNSLFIGTVNENKYFLGGLIFPAGMSDSVDDSFWDVDTTGVPMTPDAYGIGLTTKQLKENRSIYLNAGWDLENVWTHCNGSYAELRQFAHRICEDVDGDGFDNSVDCNDSNASINPNAIEVCDGVDNDCVGGLDDGNVCGSLSGDLIWRNLVGDRIVNASVGDSVYMEVPGSDLNLVTDGNFTIYKDGGGAVWWNPFTWFDDLLSGSVVSNFFSFSGFSTGEYYYVFESVMAGINNQSETLSLSEEDNALPHVSITNDDANIIIRSTIEFNQTSYDEDDLLDLIWDFDDGTEEITIENYSLVNGVNGNVVHTFDNAGVFNVELTGQESERVQNSRDSVRVNVFEPGINVVPVISSPLPGKEYGNLVLFNLTSSYVSNCSAGFTSLDQCQNIHSPGEFNTTDYGLYINWTIDGESYGPYEWEDNFFEGVLFYKYFENPGSHDASVNLIYMED
jgi:cysteine-rich repeat protein